MSGYRHPGDYLERRMGLGRQCWDGSCDVTPCVCPKDEQAMVKRSERRAAKQRLRLESREQE